jgi:hypothetical protein
MRPVTVRAIGSAVLMFAIASACVAPRRSLPVAPSVGAADGGTLDGSTRLGAPALLLGAFVDDYGGTFRIDSAAWHHGTHSTYEVVAWHADSQYVIARNGARNRSDAGLWTRIDWVKLNGMSPYTWGFCLSAFKAETQVEAEQTRIANRAVPRTGCNGYPFTRMRRAE